jgi:peptide/nickel transport system permease protein
MTAYIFRRILYTIPLVFGICLVTFFLFEWVFTPRVRAIRELGGKRATEKEIQDIITARGWDKGLFFNSKAAGLHKLTDTRFMDHMGRLLLFRFGRSEKTSEPIGRKILNGMVPSLTLTVPIFFLGLFVAICLSLTAAYLRATYLDLGIVVICVAFMSVSILVYIIGGQYVLAQNMRMFPVYGYAPGLHSLRFVLLPVLIDVLAGLGSDVRFYRTIMLEETGRDYVRTARAKGLGERVILFKHVLKNAMIPILTRTVLAIPFLFMGALLLERFFGIPGLGNMTIEAIESGDFPVLSAMVYLGGLLFAVGNLATDISYTLVDPRVALR